MAGIDAGELRFPGGAMQRRIQKCVAAAAPGRCRVRITPLTLPSGAPAK